MPQAAIDLVAEAATLVKHMAIQLGTVTHLANHHKVTVTKDDGQTVVKTLRDSTAGQQQPRKFRVRPALETPVVTAPSSVATNSQGTMVRKRPLGGLGIHQSARLPSAKRSKGTAAKHLDALRQELLMQEQLAQWVATRELVPSSGPSASLRMEQMRQRLRDKQSRGDTAASGLMRNSD